MPILPGRRLGPYEILIVIGAGGMGEVYKARDTRLNRIVAIKVLPAHLADRAELRERFEREARTIASLNHPHICVLHDIGQQDGTDYLVMEYLEGETLAQRLQKGPLPLEQVFQYAIEISDALDKAHRKGVTHRDLKPGNIMLTKTGTKLLDFGLAKLKREVVPANVPLSELPTAKDPLTAQGTIVGTLQYMAPEQLEGKEVDARTDIFAFGVVVYEMATGKRAFEGKSQASLIAAILEREPPAMSSLQPMTPPALDRVVKKCLAKEPDKRWQTASDVCDELKWIAEESRPRAAPSPGLTAPNKMLRRWIVLSALACLIVAGIAGLAVWNLKPSPTTLVSRSVFFLPPGQRFPANVGQSLDMLALSPDGKHLVYVANEGGANQLYLRSLDSFVARPIPGTEGATDPFFSPDSEWVGFFVPLGKLKKVSISGGAAVTLCDAQGGEGATWGPNGMIIFTPTPSSGLAVVSAEGGTPQPLTTLDSKKGETSHRWPEFLPGGKAVLFMTLTGSNLGATAIDWPLELYMLKTGERRDLMQVGSRPRYAPSGHVVYAQGTNLMAAPFDSGRMALTGASVPVVEGVARTIGVPEYAVSDNGALGYLPGVSVQATQLRLVWVDRKGAEQPIAAPPQAYRNPRVSPDGRRVAVSIIELGTQIWIYDLGRDTLTRLTFEGNPNLDPVWTPDRKRVAFSSGNPRNLFWQAADGSGKAERLTTNDYIQSPNSWLPDGQSLAFTEMNPTTGRDVWVLGLSDRTPHLFLRTPFTEAAPRFSPDGRWLAYVSDESGHFEVYVQPYPGPGGKWQISTESGTEPVWNPNGRELFYRSGGKMMAVDIATQPGFAAGKPRMLFEGRYSPTPLTSPNYDVSPDGQRFLMLKPSEQAQAAPTQINVVLNWFEELKQKVPVGKK
jgi:eukaryotic-like serine/threonine-protein kinase